MKTTREQQADKEHAFWAKYRQPAPDNGCCLTDEQREIFLKEQAQRDEDDYAAERF